MAALLLLPLSNCCCFSFPKPPSSSSSPSPSPPPFPSSSKSKKLLHPPPCPPFLPFGSSWNTLNPRPSPPPPRPSPPLASALAAQDLGAVQSGNPGVELAFIVGSEVIPHPDKVHKGGEDAFFVSSFNGGVLGIADGVSGWAEENVDPALFSRELMAHAAAAVGDEEIENNPQLLLGKAHEATCAIGAATAIIAMLERQGILHVASVGDCGLRLIRGGKVVFATSPQQHFFDCPFQLSSELVGQTSTDALVYNLHVKEGDTVVMGSDGLFDNVYDTDIEATVNLSGGSDQECAQHTAAALAVLASKHAMNKKYDSPYCHEAILQGYDVPIWKKIFGKKLTGGKPDDITVLVAHVVDAQLLPRDEMQALNRDEDEIHALNKDEMQVLPGDERQTFNRDEDALIQNEEGCNNLDPSTRFSNKLINNLT